MGSLWTLPAPWTRRRAHRALDRPQTACPQRPQALISSLYKPGVGAFALTAGEGIVNPTVHGEGPGEFQALAEQRMAGLTSGCAGPIGRDVSVAAGRARRVESPRRACSCRRGPRCRTTSAGLPCRVVSRQRRANRPCRPERAGPSSTPSGWPLSTTPATTPGRSRAHAPPPATDGPTPPPRGR